MKAYLGKILICTVPVVIACVIVGWAFYQYRQEKGGFRLGVDLVGGTILVYQIDPTKPGGSGDKLNELAASLKRRIDPSDLYNVTIRPVPGDPPRVEVILPTGGKGHGEHSLTEEEVEKMRGLIQQQGRLEFRILANTEDDSKATEAAIETLRASKAAVERARETGDPPPPPSQDAYPVTLFGETSEHRYSWMEIGKEELYNLHLNNAMENDPKYGPNWQFVAEARKKGEAVRTSDFNPRTGTAVVPQLMRCLIYSRTIPPDRMKKLSKEDREAGKKYEYFVLTREESADRGIVEGKHLDSVSAGTGPRNERAGDFTLNSQGAILFADLTTRNRPSSKDENAFKRHLAILLDNMVQSAPTIQTPITGGRGQITLGDSKPEDVETLLRILRAGALPATIIPNPVAQNTMGATLGADTIKKGTYSVVLAFAAVLLFMAVYYRFAGLVACFALLANLILTVAFMVLVSATFTLPGLAGLVLMLGMAVDANILI